MVKKLVTKKHLKYGSLNISYNPKKMRMKVRRMILKRRVKANSYATIIRRLNILKEFNKHTNKQLSNRVFRDMKYLKRIFKK